MRFSSVLALSALGFASCVFGQSSVSTLAPQTAIPVTFPKAVDAAALHPGDIVHLKTTQAIIRTDGSTLPSGSEVIAHVVQSQPFVFDKTPYAKQTPSSLSLHFDKIVDHGKETPISVYVRAMADPFITADSRRPKPSDEDSLGTLTQVGGDLLVPSQNEVTNYDGDTVGYNRHGGVYAHLISAQGNSSEGCDGTSTEQSMGVFSASACGLYGYTDTTLQNSGRTADLGTLALSARRRHAVIYAHSAALLEVLPQTTAVAAR